VEGGTCFYLNCFGQTWLANTMEPATGAGGRGRALACIQIGLIEM